MKMLNTAAAVLLLIGGGCATVRPEQPGTALAIRNAPSFAQRSHLGQTLADLENTGAGQTFSAQLLPHRIGLPLHLGDIFTTDLVSSADGFAALYLFQADGTVSALTENLPVTGGRRILFPPPGSDFHLRATPPTGENTLLLLLTRKPIQGTIGHQFKYLPRPQSLLAPRAGAIAEIKQQMRGFLPGEWASDILDISVQP